MEELDKNKKVIMSPVVKYLREGCCETEGTARRWGRQGTGGTCLTTWPTSQTRVTKALCGEKRIKNYKVVNPN
jgi:hypothetical protein